MFKKIIFTISLFCLSLLLLFTFYLQSKATSIHFEDANQQQIQATYYPGTMNQGILIALGFSSSQRQANELILPFLQAGFHVYTFDYAGHGFSEGVFPMNGSDSLVLTLEQAIQQFKSVSSLSSEQMVLYGHSMSAKAILEYTLSSTTPYLQIFLVAPNIDVTQSELLPFFDDSYTSSYHLYRGSFDEIFTAKNQSELGALLQSTTYTAPFVFHNFEVNSQAITQQMMMTLELDCFPYSLFINLLWLILGLTAFLYFSTSSSLPSKSIKHWLKQYALGLPAILILIGVIVFFELPHAIFAYPFVLLSSILALGIGITTKATPNTQTYSWYSLYYFLICLAFLGTGIYSLGISSTRFPLFMLFFISFSCYFTYQIIELRQFACDPKYLLFSIVPLLIIAIGMLLMQSYAGFAGLLIPTFFLLLATKACHASRQSNAILSGGIIALGYTLIIINLSPLFLF